MGQVVSVIYNPAFWAALFVASFLADAALHLWMLRLGRQGRLQAMFDGLSRRRSRLLHLVMASAGKLMLLFGGCTAAALLHRIL